MRLISKTTKKVIIEVHNMEIEKDGFDSIWDKIREVYELKDYRVFYIYQNKEKTLTYIELAFDNLTLEKSKRAPAQPSCN